MKSIVEEFLNTPLENGDAIFNKFASLEGAIVGAGEHPLERYVYIPGTRADRVVLVAHMDTVWDRSYDLRYEGTSGVGYTEGIFHSLNEGGSGIGADDRAGCAMLWLLRDSGHSILLVDGEEHGNLGAKYLKSSKPALFKELNSHRFMIELDAPGADQCLFLQVDNTKAFKKYICTGLNVTDAKKGGGCDLQILCKSICGVNLSVGYLNFHTKLEVLIYKDWENTYNKLKAFLEKPQKRFTTDKLRPILRFFKNCLRKIVKLFMKKK